MKKVGRPTKYKKEFVQKIVKFFSKKPYREEKIITELKSGAKVTKKVRVPNPYPTIEAFAYKIGVNADTIVEWANAKLPDGKDANGNALSKLKYPEFSAAYKVAKNLQKNFLIQNSLLGLYNASFGIFVGTNTTDMKDQQAVDHTTKGEKLNVTMISYKDTKGSEK